MLVSVQICSTALVKHMDSQPGSIDRKTKAEGPRFEFNERQLLDIREAFDLFDVDGIGKINTKELKVAIRAMGFEPKKEEIRSMLAEVDGGKNGKLSYEEFVKLIAMKVSERDTSQDLVKSFRLFDERGKGRLNFETLLNVARDLGEELTEEQVQEMIDEADLNEDGDVDEEEFLKMLKRECLVFK